MFWLQYHRWFGMVSKDLVRIQLSSQIAHLPHDPDEIDRTSPFDERIGYNWDVKHG